MISSELIISDHVKDDLLRHPGLCPVSLISVYAHLLVVAVHGVVRPDGSGGPQHGAVHPLGPDHGDQGPQTDHHQRHTHTVVTASESHKQLSETHFLSVKSSGCINASD